MKPDKIKEAYNNLCESYYVARKNKNSETDFFNTNLEMPTTLKLLENVKNKKILDLGCGPGFYTKILNENGAKIKGIDISEESIKIAQKENPSIELKVGDITKKLPFKNSEFDIVLSSLVLDHIENWNPVFKEVNRVLKKGGMFIFSTYNPVVFKVKRKKWFFKKIREYYGYFDENMVKEHWGKEIIEHHHKTYGTRIRFIVNNGFEIIDYEDSFPSKESEIIYPKYYKRYSQVPKFCTWKVKKK